MSARRDVGAALRHAAELLRKGEPLPADYAAWLAYRLAAVSRVLLDDSNREPDAAVMEALGAGAKRGRPPKAGKAARDAELAKRAGEIASDQGLPQKTAADRVAQERNKQAADIRELFGTSPEVEAFAAELEVSDRMVRRAREGRRRKP